MLPAVNASSPAQHNALFSGTNRSNQPGTQSPRHQCSIYSKPAGKSSGTIHCSPNDFVFYLAVYVGKSCVWHPRCGEILFPVLFYGTGKDSEAVAGGTLRTTNETSRKRMILE